MVRSFHVFAGLALLGLPASAQSIHVDFGPAGSPLGVPSPAYGASNGMAGVWNKVSSLLVTDLVAWDGSPTNASLYCIANLPPCPEGNAFFITNDFPETFGGDRYGVRASSRRFATGLSGHRGTRGPAPAPCFGRARR